MIDMAVLQTWLNTAVGVLIAVALKILGALVIWIIGRKLISIARRMTARALEKRKIDPTLIRYADSVIGVMLEIVLIVAVLGMFGVETTSFAALLAAAGVAIGMAWSGMLSNFAAGAFMIVLRPFKVGDFVTAGGITGTVVEIGLFVTTINTMDNVRTFVGNSKVFSDVIQNFSANPYRRVDLTAQLAHSVDVDDAIKRLKERLAAMPHVAKDPPPDVHILTFTLAGPVLAVRPYTHTDTYWDVFFATNKAIADVGGEAGYAVPEQRLRVLQAS
jgi:small conductance mechanosensitive channel